jgi:hypothetical protein
MKGLEYEGYGFKTHLFKLSGMLLQNIFTDDSLGINFLIFSIQFKLCKLAFKIQPTPK